MLPGGAAEAYARFRFLTCVLWSRKPTETGAAHVDAGGCPGTAPCDGLCASYCGQLGAWLGDCWLSRILRPSNSKGWLHGISLRCPQIQNSSTVQVFGLVKKLSHTPTVFVHAVSFELCAQPLKSGRLVL